jgi:hypothetical protein
MIDLPEDEAHNVPEVEASSRFQRVKSLMLQYTKVHNEVYSTSCVKTIRSACSLN